MPNPSDPSDVIPSSWRDVMALADKAIERYWSEPTIFNMYPMALLTSHVVDWYVARELGLKKGARFTAEFAKAYPRWDAVRDIGNGFKHATVTQLAAEQFATEDMFIEHVAWWDGAAYGVMFQGQMVPVDSLCFFFLREFTEDVDTGRIRELLSRLHPET